ncbi:MAG TPA: alpha/beta fold hydrolase [Candidatus Acidoferrales bacterium]
MNGMKAAAVLLFLCFFPSANRVWAQSRVPDGELRFAEFGDFRLQNGRVIHNFRLGYRTFGQLDAGKSNAILWPTWLGGISQELLQFVGPGKVLDPSKYFVVLVDAIGDGVSSSPSNSKDQRLMKFPEFSIRDMVEAEHRLATDVLHVDHLRAVVGVSMGGMQTFSWAVAYPDFMDLAIPVAGSPQSTSADKLLWTAQIDAIELDPAWNHGMPTGPLTGGLALADEIGEMSLTSPAYRVAHTGTDQFGAYLSELRKKAATDAGTACNHIRQRQAIMALDIPKELGVSMAETTKRAHAKFLIVVSQQDHVVNPTPALAFAAADGAPVITLNSDCGHSSTACISLGPTIGRFLVDPSSVRSETLTDPANP